MEIKTMKLKVEPITIAAIIFLSWAFPKAAGYVEQRFFPEEPKKTVRECIVQDMPEGKAKLVCQDAA